jgi:predicted Fe-Mo cluster-binding NifX family protein
MKIAMPVENGILFGHFGGAPKFEVFTLNEENKIVNRELLNPPQHGDCNFAAWLKGFDVNVMIVSGIGQGAINHFQEMKIEVFAGAENKKTEELINDYINNSLKLSEVSCNHDHHKCH